MPARELRNTEVQLAEPAAPPVAPVIQPPGSVLVVPPRPLQLVAIEMVLADFEAAKRARDERNYGIGAKGETLDFDKWLKELIDLYYGRRLPKTVPWKFCSNRSLMIAMAILETMHARIFPAIYNEDLTRWRPGELQDVERAERVEKFMYWWSRVRSQLSEFFERWSRVVIGLGEALTVTSWDVVLRDKGAMQPTLPMMMPGMLPVPPQKVLERFERSRSDIIPADDIFLQPGPTDIQRDTVIIRRKYLFRDLEEMERNGSATNVMQPSEDGLKTIKEYFPVPAATVEGLDPQQLEELANVRRRNLPVECLEWHGGIDLDGDGFPELHRILICPQSRVYLSGVALKDLSSRGIRHLDFTTFAPRFDEPMSLRGLGVLEQVKELALEIDAIFNQLTDANSLAVLRPFFYDPSGDLDAPAVNLAPNKGTPLPNPQQNIYFPEINIPTEKLLNAITMVMEFIERLTGASAYVMGKESEIVGGSGTATRTNAIVGAAGQRHAIPINRMRLGAARILTQHLDLVQKNIPPGLESRVLGEKGEPVFEANELTAEGIRGEFDAYLLPDESLGSKEAERQLAQMLYQLLIQNLIVSSDPTKIYKITADLLKAYGKDPESYLGVAPDVKQTDRPEDENTLIIQGQFASVKASVLDNPIEHILKHTELLQDPVLQTLDPAMQQMVMSFTQAHIQEHLQMLQLVIAAAQKEKSQQGGKGGGTTEPGSNGAQGGTAGAAPPVGPEPGMGSVQNPLAAAGGTQRIGESQSPA